MDARAPGCRAILASVRTARVIGMLCCTLAAPGYSLAAECGRTGELSLEETPWTDNGDGTLGDERTDLMWKRCPEGLVGERCNRGRLAYLTWEQAQTRARQSNFAGYNDWRIPRLDELRRLIQPGCELPAVNLAAFPNTPSGWFWFASAEAFNSPRAGQLGFAFGENFSANQRHVVHLRLVREAKREDEAAPGDGQAVLPGQDEGDSQGPTAPADDQAAGLDAADQAEAAPADQRPDIGQTNGADDGGAEPDQTGPSLLPGPAGERSGEGDADAAAADAPVTADEAENPPPPESADAEPTDAPPPDREPPDAGPPAPEPPTPEPPTQAPTGTP